MSGLQIIRFSETLIFIITIPIFTNREYRLYQPIPLPIKKNNLLYALIQKKKKILIINGYIRRHYIFHSHYRWGSEQMLDMQQYSKCLNWPTYFIQTICDCEIKLLNCLSIITLKK